MGENIENGGKMNKNLLLNLLQLLRDICESMYYGFPDEIVEEAFENALQGGE